MVTWRHAGSSTGSSVTCAKRARCQGGSWWWRSAGRPASTSGEDDETRAGSGGWSGGSRPRRGQPGRRRPSARRPMGAPKRRARARARCGPPGRHRPPSSCGSRGPRSTGARSRRPRRHRRSGPGGTRRTPPSPSSPPEPTVAHRIGTESAGTESTSNRRPGRTARSARNAGFSARSDQTSAGGDRSGGGRSGTAGASVQSAPMPDELRDASSTTSLTTSPPSPSTTRRSATLWRWSTLSELRDALARAKADRDVHVVVLTGAGEQRVLGRGGPVGRRRRPQPSSTCTSPVVHLVGLMEDLWALGKPTIAKVRGYCLAGGFGVALSCDIVVASTDAVFGTPEIDVGIWPMMITVPLVRSLPPKRALGADDDRPAGERGGGRAARLRQSGGRSRGARRRRGGPGGGRWPPSRRPRWGSVGTRSTRCSDLAAGPALALLQASLTLVTSTEDAAEGIRAFQEKRPPVWSGR